MSAPTVTATEGLLIVEGDEERVKLVRDEERDDWLLVHDTGEITVQVGAMDSRDAALAYAHDILEARPDGVTRTGEAVA